MKYEYIYIYNAHIIYEVRLHEQVVNLDQNIEVLHINISTVQISRSSQKLHI